MQKLHNFMDRMREKSVEERRKLLFGSTTFFGVLIALFGLWNISNSLVSLNTNSDSLATGTGEEEVKTPSTFASLRASLANAWTAVEGGLRDLNDKLGKNQEVKSPTYIGQTDGQ